MGKNDEDYTKSLDYNIIGYETKYSHGTNENNGIVIFIIVDVK